MFLNISSLARWTGPPVGIARVEHALARAATARPGTLLCFWDARESRFRVLRSQWADIVLGWQGAADVPVANRSWLSRHRWFVALERIRLTVPVAAPFVAAVQDRLLALRPHGHRVRDADGRLRGDNQDEAMRAMLSIGAQTGPPIGVQKGPLSMAERLCCSALRSRRRRGAEQHRRSVGVGSCGRSALSVSPCRILGAGRWPRGRRDRGR